MGVNNLAEQCYLTAHGPLQNMTVLSMMDMVKVVLQSYTLMLWCRSVALTFVGLIAGVRYRQIRDREESKEADGAGVCGDQQDSANREEEGVHKKQQ